VRVSLFLTAAFFALRGPRCLGPAAAEMAAMSKDQFREFSDTVLASTLRCPVSRLVLVMKWSRLLSERSRPSVKLEKLVIGMFSSWLPRQLELYTPPVFLIETEPFGADLTSLTRGSNQDWQPPSRAAAPVDQGARRCEVHKAVTNVVVWEKKPSASSYAR